MICLLYKPNVFKLNTTKLFEYKYSVSPQTKLLYDFRKHACNLCQFRSLTAPGHSLISLCEGKQCEFPSKVPFCVPFKKRNQYRNHMKGEQK